MDELKELPLSKLHKICHHLDVVFDPQVDRDKKKLEMMQQRIREDEQTLSELKRVEGERGGESDAVRLVFPTPDGPRM